MKRANDICCSILLLVAVSSSATAADIIVNSTTDTTANDGVCTLREAINAANTDTPSGVNAGECAAGFGGDTIEFSVAGTIQPGSGLPAITTPIHINGYSAPGASRNILPQGQGTNAVLKIEIDGVNAGNVNGLTLDGAGASGSIIEGLAINNSGGRVCCAQNGIELTALTGPALTYIIGNFIGTNISGTAAAGKGSRGILIWNDSGSVFVGSDISIDFQPGAVNLIAGNELDGVSLISATGMRIRGNLIGVNATGSAALPNLANGFGIESTEGSYIIENVISGNGGTGIRMTEPTNGLFIWRNFIGVNAAGLGAVPNSEGGIRIQDNPVIGPTSIHSIELLENLVANNLCTGCSGGISIGLSNSINTVDSVSLVRNRIHSNAGLEIDLGETNGSNDGIVLGVTPNDVIDADSGANSLQNFPVIASAFGNGSSIAVDFSLNSEVSTFFIVEFFHTDNCDASGHGGSQEYLGDKIVLTDPNGDVADQLVLASDKENGFITATATKNLAGTSEFSACFPISSDTIFEDGFESP